MVERKKRKSNHRNNNESKMNQKRRISYDNNDGKINKDELVVYRILCPVRVIGGVIGKSGTVINSIRHNTKAKIKVFDQSPGCSQRVITIHCLVKEKKKKQEEEIDITKSENEPLCCAQDALLKVHDAIVASAGEKKNTKKKIESCRLLVPSSQSSIVIGKSGLNIRKIRSRSGASVEVVSKDVSDPSHACAMEFDNIVLISGEPEAVKKALFAVSATMYKINPREQIPLDSTGQEGYAETASNPMPVFGFGGSSRVEELVLKVLCSLSSIRCVIGEGGSTIERIREASGSRIEVDDSLANHSDDECVITVTATESHDDVKSMAIEAVLLLQEKINYEDEGKVKMQLLVPSKVVGCVIGRSGSVMAEIRKRTNANIRITKGKYDDLVEVSGEVSSVRDALIQIVLRLREDVIGDRGSVSARKPPARSDDNSFFSRSSNPGFAPPSYKSSVPEFPPLNFDQRREMVSSDGFYGYRSFLAGDNCFGSVGPYSFGGLHPSSALEILVPAGAMSRVMGKGGGNLENIRRISGGMVEISDSKTSHGGRIALISGTPDQMRTAEDLVQAFIMST